MKTLARVFTCLCAAAVSVGLYLAAAPVRDPVAPRVSVHEAERELGAVALGQTLVSFRVHNPSDRERRITGVTGRCQEGVCFDSDLAPPTAIPAGGSIDIPCALLVTRPGPFQSSISVYLDEESLREVILTVRGVGVVTSGASHDP